MPPRFAAAEALRCTWLTEPAQALQACLFLIPPCIVLACFLTAHFDNIVVILAHRLDCDLFDFLNGDMWVGIKSWL